MTGSLSGIKVIELTTMITGPLAGMMLADLGADVIKIENPEGGDTFRSFRGGLYSPHFCGYNRNKRSLALDLRADFGRRAFEKLVARSDVLLINSGPACSSGSAIPTNDCSRSTIGSSAATSAASAPTAHMRSGRVRRGVASAERDVEPLSRARRSTNRGTDHR